MEQTRWGGGGISGGAEINGGAVSYLKQLVRFQLLGAEHDSVGVAPNPAGLAAITQQHHVFAVFTVEPMGNTCNYKQKKAFNNRWKWSLQRDAAKDRRPGDWIGKLFSVMLLVHRLLSRGPEELVMDT